MHPALISTLRTRNKVPSLEAISEATQLKSLRASARRLNIAAAIGKEILESVQISAPADLKFMRTNQATVENIRQHFSAVKSSKVNNSQLEKALQAWNLTAFTVNKRGSREKLKAKIKRAEDRLEKEKEQPLQLKDITWDSTAKKNPTKKIKKLAMTFDEQGGLRTYAGTNKNSEKKKGRKRLHEGETASISPEYHDEDDDENGAFGPGR